MKIYFCASIRGGRQLAADYARMITMLEKHGQVLTEHLGNDQRIASEDAELSDSEIHDRDMDWIREADLLVAEVSVNSLGVGYEIGRAIELQKRVICIFRKDTPHRLSAMIAGSRGVEMHHYTNTDDLEALFSQLLLQAPED